MMRGSSPALADGSRNFSGRCTQTREEKTCKSKCQKFYWMLHLSKPSPALSHPKMSVKMSSPNSKSAKPSSYPELPDPQEESF